MFARCNSQKTKVFARQYKKPTLKPPFKSPGKNLKARLGDMSPNSQTCVKWCPTNEVREIPSRFDDVFDGGNDTTGWKCSDGSCQMTCTDPDLNIAVCELLGDCSTSKLTKSSSHNLQKNSSYNLQKTSSHNLQKTSSHNLQKTSSHNLQKISSHNLQKYSSPTEENHPNAGFTTLKYSKLAMVDGRLKHIDVNVEVKDVEDAEEKKTERRIFDPSRYSHPEDAEEKKTERRIFDPSRYSHAHRNCPTTGVDANKYRTPSHFVYGSYAPLEQPQTSQHQLLPQQGTGCSSCRNPPSPSRIPPPEGKGSLGRIPSHHGIESPARTPSLKSIEPYKLNYQVAHNQQSHLATEHQPPNVTTHKTSDDSNSLQPSLSPKRKGSRITKPDPNRHFITAEERRRIKKEKARLKEEEEQKDLVDRPCQCGQRDAQNDHVCSCKRGCTEISDEDSVKRNEKERLYKSVGKYRGPASAQKERIPLSERNERGPAQKQWTFSSERKEKGFVVPPKEGLDEENAERFRTGRTKIGLARDFKRKFKPYEDSLSSNEGKTGHSSKQNEPDLSTMPAEEHRTLGDVHAIVSKYSIDRFGDRVDGILKKYNISNPVSRLHSNINMDSKPIRFM